MSLVVEIPRILVAPRYPSVWSQEPAVGPYTELHEYDPPPPKVNFNLSSFLPLVVPSDFPLYFFGTHNPSDFPTKTPYEILVSPLLAVCPARLITRFFGSQWCPTLLNFSVHHKL